MLILESLNFSAAFAGDIADSLVQADCAIFRSQIFSALFAYQALDFHWYWNANLLAQFPHQVSVSLRLLRILNAHLCKNADALQTNPLILLHNNMKAIILLLRFCFICIMLKVARNGKILSDYKLKE